MFSVLVYVVGRIVDLRLSSVAVLHSHVIPRLFRGQFLNSDFEDLAGRVEGN